MLRYSSGEVFGKHLLFLSLISVFTFRLPAFLLTFFMVSHSFEHNRTDLETTLLPLKHASPLGFSAATSSVTSPRHRGMSPQRSYLVICAAKLSLKRLVMMANWAGYVGKKFLLSRKYPKSQGFSRDAYAKPPKEMT